MQTLIRKGERIGVYGQFEIVNGNLESTDEDQDLRRLGLRVGHLVFTRACGFAKVAAEPTQHTVPLEWRGEPPDGACVEVLYYGALTTADGERFEVPLLQDGG